jgi:SAM-dependent methyltransferase
LRQKGYEVVGCDQSPHAIERGKSQGRLKEAMVADITRLPFEDQSFDLVVCSEVLEHVPDDTQALKELLRVAKSKVLITVPAHAYLWTDSDVLLLHHRRYSQKELLDLIKKTQATCLNLQPFGAIPGLGILAYRLMGAKSSGKPATDGEKPQPLAARFKIPGFVEQMLYGVSIVEMNLSRWNLMPWGHAWWAVLEKAKV